MIAYI